MKHSQDTLPTFSTIIFLIKSAKDRIIKAVNTETIHLYWQIGKEVSERTENAGWGKSVVQELADTIASNFGHIRRFSAQNIWRMKQFYETYKDKEILSALLEAASRGQGLDAVFSGSGKQVWKKLRGRGLAVW